jgi:hypothetical protein
MSTNTKTKSGRGATTIAYLALPEYKVQHQGLPDRISNTSQAAQHQTFCKRLCQLKPMCPPAIPPLID